MCGMIENMIKEKLNNENQFSIQYIKSHNDTFIPFSEQSFTSSCKIVESNNGTCKVVRLK